MRSQILCHDRILIDDQYANLGVVHSVSWRTILRKKATEQALSAVRHIDVL
jgi:hypothetical protein